MRCVLRFAVVLLVLVGVSWGVTEHDAVISSAVGVAPPLDDAPRATEWIEVGDAVEDDGTTTSATLATLGSDRMVAGQREVPGAVAGCGSECAGAPTLRGPPRA
jgi:hypothetical protein